MKWFIVAVLCLGSVVSFYDKMLPNERISLDDCHLRYYNVVKVEVSDVSFGIPTRVKEFPHMAAIGWTVSDGFYDWIQIRCGGSLVWYNFVLTAAHCVQAAGSVAPDVVRIGDVDFYSDQWAQQFRIVQIIKHPEYRAKSSYHDIALLKLDRDVVVNEHVIPACLWTDEEVRSPKLVATGWGRTGEGEELSPNLLKVSLEPISNQECSQFYKFNKKIEQGLQPQQLCAVDEKMDTCEGDSGGPLQVKLTHNGLLTPFVVGITSFGSACGFSVPGVYTRVSSYFKWIVDTMRQNGAINLEDNYNETYCALRFATYRKFNLYTPNIYDYVIPRFTINREYTPDALTQIQWETFARSDCYGMIVDDETVLTVANCTTFKGIEPSHVIYLKDKIMPIAKILKHPGYTHDSALNNIAILKMNYTMDLPLWFRPSCISEDIKGYLSYYMYGKGRNDINDISSEPHVNPRESIREIETSLQNASSCILPKYVRSLLNSTLTSDLICFGNDGFLIPKSCNQLTGSMIGYIQNGFYRTVALSLYSRDCGFGEHLIGTHLRSHIDWLKSVFLPDYRDSSAFQFVDVDLKEGDNCTLNNGVIGQCVPLNTCKNWQNQSKGSITFCSSASTVCCSLQNNDSRELFHPDILNCSIDNPRKSIYGSLARIGWISNGTLDFHCFGSIISRKSVVTTASCLQNSKSIIIKLIPSGVQLDVISVVQHSKFNLHDLSNDIALVKLKNALSWTDTIFPVCLWTNLTHTPLDLHINQLSYDKDNPKQLHPRYNSDCQRAYRFILIDSQLCTRSPYESAVCVAPSDQLIWNDAGTVYLVGLSNNACTPETKQYSLFTRISSFVEWICMYAFES